MLSLIGVLLFVLMLNANALAVPMGPITFELDPIDGSIDGLPNETIGWGISILN